MPSETLVQPDDWDRHIAATEGPQLVVGGPGSGKTEFLVRRARLLIERGVPLESLIVLTFSRRAAAALRDRISSSLGRSISRLPASTFHSLSMRILDEHWEAVGWTGPPTLLTGPEQVALVAEVLRSEDGDDWPQPFRALLHDAAFADEVSDFVLRAAERLADGEAIAALRRADWRAIPGFLDRYRAALVERGRIDYGTLQTEAVALLHDPDVRESVTDRVEYVLVDEYQDTTVAQAAIVEGLARSGNVTVAGDPYQSIYGFRGAELSNVDRFPDRFRAPDGSPAHRLVLTTSFRVSSRILDAAVRVTEGAGLPGAVGRVRPAGSGGSVETYAFDQQSNEAEWIASEIQRLHLRDRIPYSRIAVLVRSKRGFMPEISRSLDRRSIPHDQPDSRLVDHPVVRPVLDLVRVVTTDGAARAAALRRVLLGPLCRLTLSAARDIERLAVSRGWDAALDHPAVSRSIASLVSTDEWAVGVPAAEGFWRVWTALDAYADIVADEKRADDRRAVASFGQALSRLADRDPAASLLDYALMSEAEDFEATPLLEYHGESDRLTLTTLHQSKGMTFDVVFVADAREGVLPDLRTRDSLLGARHLSPTHRGDDTAYARFRLQEEMRLAYSAMCRAAVRVVWTCTTTGFEGGDGVPSRFLPLVAGSTMEEATRPPQPWSDPTTPLEAEAWLRRRLDDPRSALVDRLAAATLLVDSSSWARPRHPSRFAGILERGRDTGLVPDDPTLSASQADSYMTCARRYAFERRLRIDRGGSSYQLLGSLVHAALESAERRAAERGEDHATVDEALAALDAVFDPDDFGGGPWGEAWRARASAIVTKLYEQWPGEGPGVDFERPFEVELDDVTWRGRVDRLESRGDAIHVVDYKTSATAPTVAEASESLQLGLYVLGLRQEIDQPVTGAEYWYPGTLTKSVTTRSLDLDRLPDVRLLLAKAARGIIAEDWTPSPGAHCGRCPVRIACPEWPEGQEAYRP